MKVIYAIATGEVVGSGSDGISVEAPIAVADAPVNYGDYPPYFWHYVDPDIVLKEDAELAIAVATQKAETAQSIIDKHAKEDAVSVRTVGKFEENGDIVNQVLRAVLEFAMNGTAIPQALYDQFVLYQSKVSPSYCVDITTMEKADMDAVAAAKAKARTNAQAIVNDPDWPY